MSGFGYSDPIHPPLEFQLLNPFKVKSLFKIDLNSWNKIIFSGTHKYTRVVYTSTHRDQFRDNMSSANLPKLVFSTSYLNPA